MWAVGAWVIDTIDTFLNSLKSQVNNLQTQSSGGVQIFTSNGTFTVPRDVKKILVTACAGGGKGNAGGNGGDGGDWIYRQPYAVTAYSKIDITVGKGATEKGTAGSSTIIGSLVTLACPGIRGGKGGCAETEFMGQAGFAPGGLGDAPSASSPAIGGGGGSLGRGGSYKTSYGEAGTLGGGSSGSRSGYAPNDGGDGIVIIEW